MATMRKVGEHGSPCWYDDQVSFMPDLDSPRRISQPYTSFQHHYSCKQELELPYNMPHDPYLQLPQLESPKLPQSAASSSTLTQEEHIQQSYQQNMSSLYSSNNEQAVDQVTDWRVLDKFVASQLSHDQDASKETNYSNAAVPTFHVADHMNLLVNDSKRPEIAQEYASTSTSSCQIDLWK
ncbi:NAC domain-containing protein 7 [Vitis vinifera]|uniref:NAC domain-containing protein 7 n=1 Tax=Vitis vinifera TaxID=29760 RepID=A0A438K310_VITVI|nr:NAC domain-containing protein 7 [Vitis vinifera]